MADPIDRYIIPPITRQTGLLIAGLISTAILGGALLFQYLGGLAPCSLCIWQRWPHLAVMILALAGLRGIQPRLMLMLICLAGIISAGLGAYHAGVEWRLWSGPTGCTASLALDGNIAVITDQLLATPLVRCDEVAWSLFGLSMAGWNALISLDIVAIALISLRKIAR
jgi:disulfide bond formation protein DsbB